MIDNMRRHFSANWPLGLVNKLEEARFFLRKLESTTDSLEAVYFCSAFISACYSITECLAATCARQLTEKAWWEMSLARLEAHPTFDYFSSGRHAEIHQGEALVSEFTISVVLTPDGDLKTFDSAALKNGGPTGRTNAPAPEADAYLQLLLDVTREGFRKFGSRWDPTDTLVRSSIISEIG